MAGSVSVSISNFGSISEELTSKHFGTNMLFHTDRVGAHSDFAQLIEKSHLTSIRYPGGTISEQFFDPSDPDNDVGRNYFDISAGENLSTVETRDVLPLSEYLRYMEIINGSATIVFPTFRYFDHDTRMLTESAEEEISAFFTDLLSGALGPFDAGNISIGNEWYQENFDWTAEEFGRLQSDIARLISTTARELGKRDVIDIFAQGDADSPDNAVLSSYFKDTNAAHIDGVLANIYGTNSAGNVLGIGGAIQDRLDDMTSIWRETVGKDLQLTITEWNVGESGEETTLINGLMRSAPLLRVFAELVQSDVDQAYIWSMQTKGPAGLSGKEGTGTHWSPTGYLFNMLHDGALGSELISTGTHFRLRDQSSAAIGYTYTFANASETNIFLASGVGQDNVISVDLSGLTSSAIYVYATVLTHAPGFSGTEYNTKAALRFETDLPVNELLSLDLGAYETIQITIGHDSGMEITADAQVAISDRLSGSALGDLLDGGMGDDTIEGRAGADRLYGGLGDDDISGGDGEDLLDGGVGDDRLNGGDGNDTLIGGGGKDTLLGAAGDDLILADRSVAFVSGGTGRDMLSFVDMSTGIAIWTADGVIEIGLHEFVYEDIEIIKGTAYSDRLTVDMNSIVASLGDGADNLTILGSKNSQIDMGFGDDRIFVFSGKGSEIEGGAGNDSFFIDDGQGIYEGGLGDDIFYLFGNKDSVLRYRDGDGDDTVFNFDMTRDSFVIDRALQDQMSIVMTPEGTVIDFGDTGSITLAGSFSTLPTDVFEFV